MVIQGGNNRIRTGVRGFADLCLATRPCCRVDDANIRLKIYFATNTAKSQFHPDDNRDGIGILLPKQYTHSLHFPSDRRIQLANLHLRRLDLGKLTTNPVKDPAGHMLQQL